MKVVDCSRAAAALAAAAVACALAACGTAGFRGDTAARPAGARPGHIQQTPASASVTVSPRALTVPVPRSYLGLSTEYWALPRWAGQMPLLERVLSLLRVPGGGPLSLRVGGDSADHSFWDPRALPMPPWAYSLAPSWLRQARELVRALRVRLILDLNLITDTPAADAVWARAAEATLPRGSIAAFEVGNEPDIYTRAAWLAITAGRPPADGRLPGALTATNYAGAFRRYAAALAQAAPHVGLAGPALANPVHHHDWIATLIGQARGSLGMVTVHRYPYTACARQHPDAAATIGRLLSPQAAGAMAADLQPTVDLAHDAGLPIRLTELNSVTCGGRPGVSDAFATALWAPDALFSLLRARVDGVNLHVRADTINAPFAITPAGLDARPLLYGLILFARTLGPRARLVSAGVRAPAAPELRAWAVRVGAHTLKVLLIDKQRRPVRVSLALPGAGAASVQRLLAPSAAARSGVTLGGRALDAAGRWRGRSARRWIAARPSGRYVLIVSGDSAALVTVRVRAGALGVPPGAPRRGSP